MYYDADDLIAALQKPKMNDIMRELPDGFKHATTGELAEELGSSKDEAKAIETRIERITGNDLRPLPPFN